MAKSKNIQIIVDLNFQYEAIDESAFLNEVLKGIRALNLFGMKNQIDAFLQRSDFSLVNESSFDDNFCQKYPAQKYYMAEDSSIIDEILTKIQEVVNVIPGDVTWNYIMSFIKADKRFIVDSDGLGRTYVMWNI